MILVRGLRLMPGEDRDKLKERAAKKLGVRAEEIAELRLVKRSLDARKKDDIHYVCSLAVALGLGTAYIFAYFMSKPPTVEFMAVNTFQRP